MLGEFSVARTAFDEANNILSLGLNSYFTAHVDLMEGKEYDALISYGGIFTTDQLGSALFDMQRLADRFPGKRDSILAFMPRMRTAWLANHLRSSALEVDYRFASLQTQHAANLRQYDRALEWNTQTLQYIDQLIQNKNVAYSWGDLWADATLNQSFYMLFNAKNDSSMLTKAIQTAEAAEQKVLRQEEGLNVYGGSADYFKTNMAHAYLLRNRPGDREKAINTYRQFLSLDVSQTGSYWDVLQKDFRDLHAAGIEWPDLKGVATEIKPPYVTLTEGEWREIEAGSER
jgi:tetratricopeptide (TPR) repeat protein